MSKNKVLSIIVVCFSTFLFFMIAACSSSPPPPIEWFNEGLELDEHDFPPGIDFTIIRNESTECLNFYDSIVVTNSSDTPLFFEAISYWGGSLENLDEPCPMDNRCLKVVSNQAWQWDVINNEETPPWDYEWTLVNKYGKSDTLSLGIGGTSVGNLDYRILNIEDLNKSGYGGDRPEAVAIPEPQKFYLPYIYDNEEYNLGVTIHYSLNECYPSENTYTGAPDFPLTTIFISVILLIIFVLILVIVLFFNFLLKLIARDEKNIKPEK